MELDDDVLELDCGSPLFSGMTGEICYCFESANFYTVYKSAKGGGYVFNISGMQGRQKHMYYNHIFHCPISFPQRGYSKLVMCKFTFFLILENMS